MARYEEQILSLNTKINTIQGKVDLSKSRRRFTIWLLYIVYMHVHRDLTLIVSDVCAMFAMNAVLHADDIISCCR